jgi:hypothetical protein
VAGICELDLELSTLIKCGEFVDPVKNVLHSAVLPAVATEARDISGLAVSSQNLMFVN